MLLPIDLVEVVMVATISIVGVIIWLAVTASHLGFSTSATETERAI